MVFAQQGISVMEHQGLLVTAAACFSVYALYLLFELLCEIDASHRGVRELVRYGLLDRDESRIARRILRGALAAYFAGLIGAGFGLWFFLACLDWSGVIGQLALLSTTAG